MLSKALKITKAAHSLPHCMSLPPEIDFDITRPEVRGSRLLEFLDAARAFDPVAWSDLQKAWLVTGNEVAAEAFKGTLPLSSGRSSKLLGFVPQEEQWRIETVRRIFPTFIVNLDPPRHTRIRKLLLKAFSRGVAESYRPFIRSTIDRTLDGIADKDQVEFVEDVARQIPGHLILELLGLPESRYPDLQRWTQSISTALGGGAPTLRMLDDVEQTFKDMESLFSLEIHRREKVPGDDFISALVSAEEDGDRLTFEEVIGTCFLTLSAGNNSTTHTLTLGTLALIRDPEARAELLGRPERLGDALMELMRFIVMSTNQVRVVTADFQWHGQHLKKGDIVNILVAAANHDPAAFTNPRQLDFSRPQAKNMTFGPGLHFCVGHFLARLQLAEFFPRLFERFPGIRVLDEELNWSNAVNFRGLKSLRVALGTQQVSVAPRPAPASRSSARGFSE